MSHFIIQSIIFIKFKEVISLILNVLVDNNTFIDKYFLGEPALSYFIELNNKKILFDTGYSDIFLTNASKMNISLANLDYIVLSHGHSDHTGGLKSLLHKYNLEKTKLIAHPQILYPKRKNNIDIGMFMSFDELSYKLEPILTKEPYWIDDNLVFLSEIPTKFPFERIKVGEVFKDNQWQDDLNFDDSAMVYKGKDGLVIITACSHSGICNIIEYSKSLFPNTKIHSIIGGFHLLKVDDKLRKTIDYLKEQDIDIIYPAHCTCLQAKIQMAKYMNIQEVGVNLKLEFK